MNEASPSCEDIALRLALRRTMCDWRGSCPACGYQAAFSLKAERDGRLLLWCANGCSQEALATAVVHSPPPRDVRADAHKEASRTRKREQAIRLWNGSVSVPGSPAAVYLASRGLADLAQCTELRFRGDTTHPQGGRLPAMIALAHNANGDPCAVHRTYLRHDGTGKADVEPAKASLASFRGGAVLLAPFGAEMAIGEGIETAAAAGSCSACLPGRRFQPATSPRAWCCRRKCAVSSLQ